MWARPPRSPIYATHDAAEALANADRVAVLHSGCLAQAGSPTVVYNEPRRPAGRPAHRPGLGAGRTVRPLGDGTVTVEVGGVPAKVPYQAARPSPLVALPSTAATPVNPAHPSSTICPVTTLTAR